MDSSENLFLSHIRLACIVAFLLVLLVACGDRERNTGWTSGVQNGTYLAISEHTQEDGIAPYLRLTVKEERIIDAEFSAVDEGGSIRRNYEMRFCAAHLLNNNAPPEVTGEVLTDWCIALANSLVQRGRSGDERPALVPIGGTYIAESEVDDDGWYARIEITYERQTLRDVVYEEYRVLESGEKSPKRDYNDLFEEWEREADLELDFVYNRLGEQLRHEGLPSGVDVISGATITSQRFRNLARVALNKRQPVDFLPIFNSR